MTLTVTDLLNRGEPDGGCLLWTGWRNSADYGYIRFEGRDQPVHRVILKVAGIVIPAGMEVDHLCQRPPCFLPEHLEIVTHAENQRRVAKRQTACRRMGHDWTDPRNVRTRSNGRRYCAECDRISLRERFARRKAAA